MNSELFADYVPYHCFQNIYYKDPHLPTHLRKSYIVALSLVLTRGNIAGRWVKVVSTASHTGRLEIIIKNEKSTYYYAGNYYYFYIVRKL